MVSPDPQIRPDTVVARNEEPVSVEVDRTVVMMSLAQGMYFGLEGTGPRIWALLERPRTVADLCDELGREFEVDPDECLRDVTAFVEELRRAQLVTTRNEAPDPLRSPELS